MKPISKDKLQIKAINLDIGPAMIFAGPGSGKTFIITHRILHYLLDCKIHPSDILVITFTKAAASEMKNRFLSLNPKAANYISFGTFHSIFYYFLRNFTNNVPTIISTEKKNQLLKQIVDNLTNSDLFEDIESLSFDISKYKNNIYKFDRTFSFSQEEKDGFLFIFTEYEKLKSNYHLIDYDDILIRFYDLLTSNPDISKQIKEKYKAILIDEFQDINEIQYLILKEIVPNNRNLFVVGDDDQSIYGFRGANPLIMKKFLEDFPETNLVELKYNYRSKQEIIDAGSKLINHNCLRMKVDKQEAMDRSQSLEAFEIKIFDTKEEHDMYLMKVVNQEDIGKIGILSRTNKDCFYYRKLLSDEKNIEDYDLYQEILTDIMFYILAAKERKRDYYLNIVNKPNRYLVRSLFSAPEVNLTEMSHKSLGSIYCNNLQIFDRQMKVLEKSVPLPFIKYLFDFVGYKRYLFERYPLKTDAINACCDRIKREAEKHKKAEEFLAFIMSSKDDKLQKKTETIENENVSITTYHSSKGLEFDTVLLPDLCEGNVPGRISLKNDNLEEERRLFYVAMTRARKKLLLLTIKNEESTSMLPSRFISEIEE